MRRVHAVVVMAQIQHDQRYHVGRFVEERDAAIGKFGHDIRIENHVAAVKWCIGHPRFDHVDVVCESGCTPHVRHTVEIARVVVRHHIQDPRIEVFPKWQLVAIQPPIDADREQTGRISNRMYNNVIAGLTCQQLRFDDLGRVVKVVVDLDAEFGLEVGDRRRTDIV